MGWSLFTSDDFKNLRECICGDRDEFVRLRQLVVNIVMATDVMDKDINALRRQRWAEAFDAVLTTDDDDASATALLVHKRSTIVLEHLIQASDVAHTMQHWHIYTKWNERLFCEMYTAYQQGRLDKDPSVSWYMGEQGFFDFYVIPLAKKLATCGVFGVSSDEYLQYAQRNREEWEQKGQELVAMYLHKYRSNDK